MSILVVGSVALDTVETPFDRREDALGGSAMYFSVAASFFSHVYLVGVVGNDFPEEAISLLKDRNVDLEGLQVEEGQTFRWEGRYHYDMNNRDTLDTQLNVFETFSPRIPEKYKSADLLFLANIHPSLQLEVLDQIKSPKLVITDTMNLWIDTSRPELMKVISHTDILLISDSEARQLTDEPSLVKAAKILLSEGPEYLIIKKGEHGAMMVGRNSIFFAPGFPLEEVIDPTGAGDVFAGGLVGYLDSVDEFNETALRQGIIYGSALASFNVENFSLDRLKKLTREEIDARYQEFKNLTTFETA